MQGVSWLDDRRQGYGQEYSGALCAATPWWLELMQAQAWGSQGASCSGDLGKVAGSARTSGIFCNGGALVSHLELKQCGPGVFTGVLHLCHVGMKAGAW